VISGSDVNDALIVGTARPEKTSPTQPFPAKPAAFERLGITVDDLIDFTPELKAEAIKIASQYRMGPLFTPPSVYDANGTKGTLQVPTDAGGANWPGAAVDPETGVLYVPSMSDVAVEALVSDPKRSDMDYIVRSGEGRGGGGRGGCRSLQRAWLATGWGRRACRWSSRHGAASRPST
jgi:quinoprotein glucose dehydrogenase